MLSLITLLSFLILTSVFLFKNKLLSNAKNLSLFRKLNVQNEFVFRLPDNFGDFINCSRHGLH